MAVVVPKNRVAMLFRRREQALKELGREARLLTKGGNLAIWITPGTVNSFTVEVAVFQRNADGGYERRGPLAKSYINLIQQRSVLMELVMELLDSAEKTI